MVATNRWWAARTLAAVGSVAGSGLVGQAGAGPYARRLPKIVRSGVRDPMGRSAPVPDAFSLGQKRAEVFRRLLTWVWA
jgi:hypothetical protein